MKIKLILFFTALSLLVGCATTTQYKFLETRQNVKQGFLLLKPEKKPVSSVILFAGGHGNLKLSGNHIGWGKGNFLVRTRDEFCHQGFVVAVVDSPSDRKTNEGMNYGFRHSEEHAMDIQAVIEQLRQLEDVPVWIIGTSNGTASVANIAARLPPPKGPDGVVFTSSVIYSGKGNSVFDADIGRIKIPALIVHHKEDACLFCPYHGAELLKKELSSSSQTELIGIEGGSSPYGNVCDAFHYHGFIGKEKEVVKIISDWIKVNSK
jgi:dienelactone hydrolase